ncbi:hypothetical protein N8742_02910 [Emcibacteraceae bacterium]|nr:hypothetical protein [Emcibacteraceae bacterium]
MIHDLMWRSQEFRALGNTTSKLVYIYIHSCKHGNATGCFHLPIGYLSTDLDLPRKEIDAALTDCFEKGLILYDRETEWVLISDFLKQNSIKNVKHGIGAARAVADIQCEAFQYDIAKALLPTIRDDFDTSDDKTKLNFKHCIESLELIIDEYEEDYADNLDI